jgi:hypothetical protein
MVFEFLCCLVEEKINSKILLASMKAFINSKASLSLIGKFSPVSTPHWIKYPIHVLEAAFGMILQATGGFL